MHGRKQVGMSFDDNLHDLLLVVLRLQKQNPGALGNRGLAEKLARSLQRLPGLTESR